MIDESTNEAEELNQDNNSQPEVKTQAVKKSTPKKKANSKGTKNELSDETFNLIQKKNQEDKIAIKDLCEEYNVAYSTFNNRKKKQEFVSNNKKQALKLKNSSKQSQTQKLDPDRTQELESQIILLKEMYMDLLLQHNQLLKKK